MTLPRTISLVILATATFAVAHAHAEMRVVTTTTDLAEFVQAIGGERVDVEALCQGHQDPHYVQARPSYMVTLSRADLLVAVGLELEVGWLPALIAGARNPDVNPGSPGYLEAAAAIAVIDVPEGEVDRAQGGLHPYGNPHFWLDPENAKLAAAAIAGRMSELDPDNEDFFRENLRAYNEQIDAAMIRWREQLAPHSGTRIVSYHQTFNYFLNRFNLVGIGYIEDRPGIPPSPGHLARLIRHMSEADIQVIFHENYYDLSTSEMVSGRTGAEILEVPTSIGGVRGVSSYIELIDYIVNSFVEAVGD